MNMMRMLLAGVAVWALSEIVLANETQVAPAECPAGQVRVLTGDCMAIKGGTSTSAVDQATSAVDRATKRYIEAKMAEFRACQAQGTGMANDTFTIFEKLCDLALRDVDLDDKVEDKTFKLESKIDDLKSAVDDLGKKL
jgi:hypothetical protein